MTHLKLEKRMIGINHPTYFIADIAANHDGDLNKAKDLIFLAAEAGSDAVKFQHFNAKDIVSDYGFKNLETQQSHQAKWKKTVFEVYQEASLPRDWTPILQETSREAGVHFFSAPYDYDAIDHLNNLNVPAHKIGSGDITWTGIIKKLCESKLPIFIATGASDLVDVERAMHIIEEHQVPVCLMQCNTNYTGDLENLKHINLNALKTFSKIWPDAILGLSDHTPGHSTVLGAVALGARAIEKHFTDNKNSDGPDHAFSMSPTDWKEMVERTRELEAALGSEDKFIAENEKETVVVQRRCLRLTRDIEKDTVINEVDIEALRPAPSEAVMPYDIERVIGKKLKVNKLKGQHLIFEDFE